MKSLCDECKVELVSEISKGGIEVFVCNSCGFKLETHFTPTLEVLGLEQDLSNVTVKIPLTDKKKSKIEIFRLIRKLFLDVSKIPVSELIKFDDKYWEVGVLPYNSAIELKKQAEELGLTIEIEVVSS